MLTAVLSATKTKIPGKTITFKDKKCWRYYRIIYVKEEEQYNI
jgi:hypothetical protein